MVGLIATLLYVVVTVFIVLMWVRFALDLAPLFSREWRPRGVLLIIAEFVFTLTDPPLKAVRKVVPPLRTSGAVIDFSWTIVLLGAIIVSYVLRGFMI
ncbi:MAG: YggT family protein [Microbacteriaceae bacterium]